MRDSNYLLKVLGLIGLPKLATIVLSLITLPIVLRSVGAEQYGIVLYVGAAVSICEVLIDFGIPSAVGRSLAEFRSSRPLVLRSEIFAWARLQFLFLVVGFMPMLFVSFLMIDSARVDNLYELVSLVSITLGFNVVLNFCQPCLQSLLAFKPISVLDTVQSVLRSIAQLVAISFIPNALGLAIAGLVTSAVVAVFSVLLLMNQLRSLDLLSNQVKPVMSLPERLRASGAFLWLRLSTRLYQELPLFLIGRLLGPELVGLIGAFHRVREILTTPYLIIGNALMVRVNEISERGSQAMASLWNAAIRVSSTSICVAAFFNLSIGIICPFLLPSAVEAPHVFFILSPLIFISSVSGIFAPMIDYMGALTLRNVILTVLAILQVPILIVSINLWGDNGLLGAYLISQVTLSIFYFLLGQRVFFGDREWSIHREVIAFSLCCIFALVITHLLGLIVLVMLPIQYSWLTVQQLILFSGLLFFTLFTRKVWWTYYFRSDFLDFTK